MAEEIRQTEVLTHEETERLFGWGENIFGELPHKLAWREKDLHFLLYADGELVSHAAVLKHEVKVNAGPVIVGGVGGVVTVPEAQGRGFARRLVRHADEFLEREWKVAAGLLFCRPELMPLYESLGWQAVESEVLIEQPSGKIVSPMPVMVFPFGGRKWPSGSIDLQSLPW